MPASVLEQTAPLKCLFLFFGINSLLYRSKSDCSFCPGCLRVRCLNASMYPPAPMMYQNRMIPRKRKESRLHQPSNHAERPELPMECILVPQEKDYVGWQKRIAFWCNLGRKNLLPGRKCLSDLIRGSRGGVKVLYKYTGARHSRNSGRLSGGCGICGLYQTIRTTPCSVQAALLFVEGRGLLASSYSISCSIYESHSEAQPQLYHGCIFVSQAHPYLAPTVD